MVLAAVLAAGTVGMVSVGIDVGCVAVLEWKRGWLWVLGPSVGAGTVFIPCAPPLRLPDGSLWMGLNRMAWMRRVGCPRLTSAFQRSRRPRPMADHAHHKGSLPVLERSTVARRQASPKPDRDASEFHGSHACCTASRAIGPVRLARSIYGSSRCGARYRRLAHDCRGRVDRVFPIWPMRGPLMSMC